MKRNLLFMLLFLTMFLVACGSESSNQDNSGNSNHERQNIANFSANSELHSENEVSFDEADQDIEQELSMKIDDLQTRKVIYTANLQIEVKDFNQSIDEMKTKLQELKGYIVESSMYSEQDSQMKSGQLTVRVPQENFQTFIKLVEQGSSRVIESSTSGQDVTEAYIDLESRLKSKRIVEQRLTTFLEEAKKTEDLLKISNDLAKVQEDIEEITGKMNYLDNKTDLATVSIYIVEKDVHFTNPRKEKLNTWEQTKQQFMKSTNFIIAAFSNLFILLIGNTPVLILLGIIITIIVFITRKITKSRK